MTFDTLPEDDAHASLRAPLVAELKGNGVKRAPLCVSIAYDW